MATAVRIRMYRPGFGDCLLLTFGRGAAARHALIDFGAHTQGDIGTMDAIMDSIEETTGRRLELLVASHAHRDHISGFGKFASRFAAFRLGAVWLPWTDNRDDPDADALTRRQLALYDALDRHLRLGLGATEDDPGHAAALSALANLRGNEPAKAELARGFGTGAEVRYLEAGDIAAPGGRDRRVVGGDPRPVAGSAVPVAHGPAGEPALPDRGRRSRRRHPPFPRFEIRAGEPDHAAIAQEGQPMRARGRAGRAPRPRGGAGRPARAGPGQRPQQHEPGDPVPLPRALAALSRATRSGETGSRGSGPSGRGGSWASSTS